MSKEKEAASTNTFSLRLYNLNQLGLVKLVQIIRTSPDYQNQF